MIEVEKVRHLIRSSECFADFIDKFELEVLNKEETSNH